MRRAAFALAFVAGAVVATSVLGSRWLNRRLSGPWWV